MIDLTQIIEQVQREVEQAQEIQALIDIRVQYLGKKGVLTEQLKQLGGLLPEERPKAGQLVNEAKQAVQEVIQIKIDSLQQAVLMEKLASESIDVTLPGRRTEIGSLHPVTLVKQRVANIFTSLGFRVADGPEIEDDYHNFTALNIPEHHPARAMQDSFYFGDGHLLRTHMSSVQIREMEQKGAPIRLVAMGRVYRCDFDITHTPMFHQLEVLFVDEHASMAQLKGLLIEFLQRFFEKEVALRLRPSYFPFTEPSAEVDMQCVNCEGRGCRVCSQTGWLEILGCGMVHPNVLSAVNIDSEKYKGFAFGLGLDRLAMLYFGIDDLRTMFENDLRFLQQF